MTDFTLNTIATAVLLAAAIAARIVAGRFIRQQNWASVEDRRRWLVRARNLTLLLVVLGLVIVWAEQLRTAALSVVAVAAAIAIAGKELIMGISGSFSRATSGSFTVGDRVQIGAHRGDVIDHSLLTTTLLELGPGHVRTGRTLVIPNSVLHSEVVANETRGHEYILHSFVVPATRREWRTAQEVLLEAARNLSEEYVVEARRHMENRARQHALSVPIVEPFVLAKPTATDTVELTVRVPVPSREVWRIEHEVMQAWLEQSDTGPAVVEGSPDRID